MRSPFTKRFWAKVNITDGCWLWTASVDREGYGMIGSPGGRKNCRTLKAHRVAWELAYSRLIPPGMCILHRCDVPRCVRPGHLFLGTFKDNTHDMHAKGRAGQWPREGEHNGRAKLTWPQVIEIRRRLAAGETQKQIAREFGVGQPVIGHIVHNRTWTKGGPVST